MTTQTLSLAALVIPDSILETPYGRLRIPGQQIPERRITLDPALLAGLLHSAREAARSAHAPYSHFHVGAALIMADDPEARVFSGANIENSSYGGTCCAERSALFAAASAGFRRLRYLAVSTVDSLDGPLRDRSPCGICRQVIREFCDPADDDGALIFIDNGTEDTLCEVLDIERLLPHGFSFAPPPGHGTHNPADSSVPGRQESR